MDNELNAKLEAAFFEAVTVKGNGAPLKFSPEEIKASNEWCYEKHGKPGNMELMVRKERALATNLPDLYF